MLAAQCPMLRLFMPLFSDKAGNQINKPLLPPAKNIIYCDSRHQIGNIILLGLPF